MQAPSSKRGAVSLASLFVLVSLGLAFAASGALPQALQQKPNRYIGAQKCKSCHGEQHVAWTKMKHAKAFEVLASDEAKRVAKEKGIADPQKAEACLKCHVTGHGKPAESFDKGFDAKLGIQCETCHGPGEKHMKARVAAAGAEEEEEDLEGGKQAAKYVQIPADEVIVAPGMKTCLECHNPDSPNFKPFCFHRANAEVRHLNPAKPRSPAEFAAVLACGEGDKCTCKHGDDGCKCGVPDPKVQKK